MTRADRTEHDSLGDVAVPADALFGAQTQRAVENGVDGRQHDGEGGDCDEEFDQGEGGRMSGAILVAQVEVSASF